MRTSPRRSRCCSLSRAERPSRRREGPSSRQDIVDGEVANVDLAPGAVSAANIRDNSVGQRETLADPHDAIVDGTVEGEDVADGSLRGFDLANDTVTGTQVAESTLQRVPLAMRANQADVATKANAAYSTYVDGKRRMNDDGAHPGPIATLTVPPGTYLIFSKLTARNETGTLNRIDPPNIITGSCMLSAGRDYDVTRRDAVAPDVGDHLEFAKDNQEVVTNQVVHTFAEGQQGIVQLVCDAHRGDPAYAENTSSPRSRSPRSPTCRADLSGRRRVPAAPHAGRNPRAAHPLRLRRLIGYQVPSRYPIATGKIAKSGNPVTAGASA